MITRLDFLILDFIQTYLRTDMGDSIMSFITRLGDGGMIWIVAAIIMLFFKKTRKAGICIAAALALTAFVGNTVLKNVFARIRPYIEADFSIIIGAPGGYSFPSGHTGSSFAAATVLAFAFKKYSVIFYTLAALIGFSRAYLYVHYPTDIIAGAVLGIVFGLVCIKGIFGVSYGKK